MFRRKLSLIIVISLVALVLTACQSEPSEDPVVDPVTIENIELSPTETETTVSIAGYLPNACYALAETELEPTADGFTIVVSATEVAEVCTQALVTFEEVVVLDTDELAAGTYTVTVNNEVREFTIQ